MLTRAGHRYIHTVLALKKLKVVELVHAPQCSAADVVGEAAGRELGQSHCDRDRAALWLKVTPHCFLTTPLFIRRLHSNFGPEPKYIEWSGLISLCGVGCFVLIQKTLAIFLANSANLSITAVYFQRLWTSQQQQQKRQQKRWFSWWV